METTQNIETTSYGIFTISKDYNRQTVLISKPSPRSRLGIKIIHHYSFRSADLSNSIMRMNLFIDKFIKEQNDNEQKIQERKAQLSDARSNFKNPFTKGDILYESGGYEQTNVYFYQVTNVKGKSITVRQLQQERKETGFMSGTTVAIKDQFSSDREITKRIQIRVWSDNKAHIYVNDLSMWDGQPKYWSSYH